MQYLTFLLAYYSHYYLSVRQWVGNNANAAHFGYDNYELSEERGEVINIPQVYTIHINLILTFTLRLFRLDCIWENRCRVNFVKPPVS